MIVDWSKLTKAMKPYEDANGEDPTHPTNLYGHAEYLARLQTELRIALQLVDEAQREAGLDAYRNADEAHRLRKRSQESALEDQ